MVMTFHFFGQINSPDIGYINPAAPWLKNPVANMYSYTVDWEAK